MTSVATCPCVRWLILPLYCIVIANGQVLKETLEIALQCGGNRWEGNTYTFEPYTFCVLCGTYLVLTYKKDKKKPLMVNNYININKTNNNRRPHLTSPQCQQDDNICCWKFWSSWSWMYTHVCWRLNPVMNVCAILKYYCIILPFRLHF